AHAPTTDTVKGPTGSLASRGACTRRHAWCSVADVHPRSYVSTAIELGFVLASVLMPATASAQTVDSFQARTLRDAAGHTLPYRLFVPEGYTASRRYGLVLFFHGAGGRGTDNRSQLTDQDAPLVFVRAENQARWPVFMLAPQCPDDQQWVDMDWSAT